MLASHFRRILAAASPISSASLPFFSHRLRRLSSMSLPVNAGGRSRLKGVVFDMDGTLTVPVIDFGAMYRAVLGDEAYASMRAGSIDILHHIETWGPQEQQRAYETIARFERQGLDRLQIMPGAMELCQYLDSRKIRRGLITRNVKDAVDLFHERFGVVCGKRAGTFTCLLDETGRYGDVDSLTDDTRPDFKVSSLVELHSLLDTHFDLLPHVQTAG